MWLIGEIEKSEKIREIQRLCLLAEENSCWKRLFVVDFTDALPWKLRKNVLRYAWLLFIHRHIRSIVKNFSDCQSNLNDPTKAPIYSWNRPAGHGLNYNKIMVNFISIFF